ncbi:XRE family transcriptional regulator [Devosia sp. SD17-2]|jgi:transcriptional regulator with XRE-family HTH domain|uniref:helix-turn-helix domain-containing protein n=1 Tax=Devosia sp. SD17-2 TaxID=2976459 RepID=UPI0023D8277E|nr:XRE family transcriptional regulator [Devosia sp. SD17-2]WEJ31510.1 XRE family transcriptional regulator [Devosia sp. SD17-2]
MPDAPDIGPIIQRERKARRLTLEHLSQLSGVSRSMLSQIERGESNPTLAVLWGLSQALKMDLGDLIDGGVAPNRSTPIEIIPVAHTPEIKSPDGDWLLRILSPPAMAGRVEWYEVEIAPGMKLASAPHASGTIEHLTAHTPGLSVKTSLGERVVRSGETARYRADVDHEIANASKHPARALMVVVYE